MRSHLALLVAALVASPASFAQTEADIMKYAEEGLPLVQRGELAPVPYYKEVFRRIQLTPASEYRFKAENLRMIGQRIDIYEAVERGEITKEKAERLIAERAANLEQSDLAAKKSAEQRREAFEQQQRLEAARAEANDLAQRRAMALQIMQMNQPRPIQIQPYIPPKQTNCTSYWTGAQLNTSCR
jgi:hypothetical protein